MGLSTLRYVILRHDGVPQPHFDLMFETSPGSALATWRSSDWPLTADSVVEPLAEHRRAYLEYEGPVSNNRGHVRRVAAGTHTIAQNTTAAFVTQLDDNTLFHFDRTTNRLL